MKVIESTSSSQFNKVGGQSAETNHSWITVVNPTNHRLLLQACDNCGVVKSENSILNRCRASKGRALVSGRMMVDIELTG